MSSPGQEGTPRIGIWGTSDLENYGDMLFPGIIEAELSRRMPGVIVRRFSPVGYAGLNRFDAGRPSEGLGPWSRRRVAELAEQLDCVVVGGGEIIHVRDDLLAPHYGLPEEEMVERAPSRFFIDGLGPDLERECPVVWSAVGIPHEIDRPSRFRAALLGRAYISVRDETSQRRLEEIGVRADLVPDIGFLLPRLWDPSLLARRLANLRAMGRFPEEGFALVVQASSASLPHVPALAEALDRLLEERGDASLVIVETGPCHGDAEFASALAGAVRGPAYRTDTVGLADIAAAIAASDGFVGTSLHGNITAFVFGKPHLALGWGQESKLAGFVSMVESPDSLVMHPEDVPEAYGKVAALGARPEVLRAVQERLDAHFDRVAGIATAAASRGGPREATAPPAGGDQALAEQLRLLRRAYEARGRLLASGHWVMAERVDDLNAEIEDLQARVREKQARIGALEDELAGRARELETLLSTRTFRYTAWPRRVYAKLRAALGRR